MSRKLSFGLLAAAAASLFVFASCGSSSDETPATGTGGSAGKAGNAGHAGTAGTTTDGGAGTAGGGGAAGGDGGGATNIDCASAEALTLNKAATGYLWPKGGKRAYSVELKADQWIVMDTVANPNDATTQYIDTVLVLYDEENNQIAFDDDSVPRVSMDSELFYHAPKDQKICIIVDEFSAVTGKAHTSYPATEAKAKFTLTVSDLDPAKFTVDTGDNNAAPGQALTVIESSTPPTSFAYVGGMLNPDTDVDVYSFKMPTGTKNFEMSVMPFGKGLPQNAITGFGGTVTPNALEITDSTGKIFARINPEKFPFVGGDPSFQIMVPIAEETDVLMWVKRPAGVVGANDFYVIKAAMSDTTNDPEKEVAGGNTNNTLATAELGCDTPPEGGTCVFPNHGDTTSTTRSYFIMGHIDPAADVDYIGFEASAGDSLALSCSSVRSGSGLIGPTFSWRDSADAEMQSETETEDADMMWSDNAEAEPSNPAVTMATAGWYYLKVSANGQDPNVTGNYYICGVHITSP
jgi:hypothetical protein